MSRLVINRRKNGEAGRSYGDLPASVGGLAAATAATAVVGGIGIVATTATVIDQQQHDDDQQDPVAVTAAEQITQTHTSHLLFVGALGKCRTLRDHLSLSLYVVREEW